MDLSDDQKFIILCFSIIGASVIIIMSIMIISMQNEEIINLYLDEGNVIMEYKICNSDDLFNISNCNDIWTIYYLKTRVLDGTTLGQTSFKNKEIYIDDMYANMVYYDDILDRKITILGHEIEHMRCECDFHPLRGSVDYSNIINGVGMFKK